MRTSMAMLFLASAGCGEFLYLKEAPTPGGVALPTSELDTATAFTYYAADGLYRAHVVATDLAGVPVTGVQYDEILASPEALDTVRLALGQLAGADPLALQDADEQLAFWLNLYNLSTLASVLERRAADASFDSVAADDFALFGTPSVAVAGVLIPLDLVEHGVLRGDAARIDALLGSDDPLRDTLEQWHAAVWNGGTPDARIHMGLNCASVGCPNLQPTPFLGATVQEQLDGASADYVDNPAKGAGPDGISQLFEWFESDFVATFGSTEDFIRLYRADAGDAVDFGASLPYDWALNIAGSAP